MLCYKSSREDQCCIFHIAGDSLSHLSHQDELHAQNGKYRLNKRDEIWTRKLSKYEEENSEVEIALCAVNLGSSRLFLGSTLGL